MKTKSISFILFVLALNASAQKLDFNKVSSVNPNVKILELNKVKIHSYVNPQLIQVTSYILELKDSLVIVDAQLTYTFTTEVVTYAQALQKPIARVIITHAHPDHFLGAYAFKDYPVFALTETIESISKIGNGARDVFVKNFGDKDAAPEVLVPSRILPTGNIKINGITFSIRKVIDSEADFMAIIEIPKAKAVIAGDFLYNKVHLFPGNNHLQSWKNELINLEGFLKGKVLLPGHGYPATSSLVESNINYLTKAIEVAARPSMDAQTYKTEMIKAFPDYGAAILMDFGAGALFKK
jgi:glyoxylase-like metal-dependent hydrolase (beta-lactamase superfamily II)